MLASAPTVPRECRAEDGWTYRPGALDQVSAPTLLLAGAESHPVLKEATGRALAAIPGARVEVLDGHAHLVGGRSVGAVRSTREQEEEHRGVDTPRAAAWEPAVPRVGRHDPVEVVLRQD